MVFCVHLKVIRILWPIIWGTYINFIWYRSFLPTPHVNLTSIFFQREEGLHIGIIAKIIITVIIFFYSFTRKISKFLEYKRPLGSWFLTAWLCKPRNLSILTSNHFQLIHLCYVGRSWSNVFWFINIKY